MGGGGRREVEGERVQQMNRDDKRWDDKIKQR